MRKGERPATMESRIERYRSLGISIGDDCHIYSSLPSGRDCGLLSIGNKVTIARNVTFLLHDAAVGTMTNYKFTDLLGKVIIGDECFIGINVTIVPGVRLANRTIVAAGSVVTKSVLREDVVIGGNPARFLGTVDDYLRKNREHFFNLDGIDANMLLDLANDKSDKLIVKSEINYYDK